MKNKNYPNIYSQNESRQMIEDFKKFLYCFLVVSFLKAPVAESMKNTENTKKDVHAIIHENTVTMRNDQLIFSKIEDIIIEEQLWRHHVKDENTYEAMETSKQKIIEKFGFITFASHVNADPYHLKLIHGYALNGGIGLFPPEMLEKYIKIFFIDQIK